MPGNVLFRVPLAPNVKPAGKDSRPDFQPSARTGHSRWRERQPSLAFKVWIDRFAIAVDVLPQAQRMDAPMAIWPNFPLVQHLLHCLVIASVLLVR